MRDPFDYFGEVLGIALGIVFAVVFYRVGEMDYGKGYITGLASIAVSLAFCFWMNMGALGVILGQLLLYGALWMYNAEKRAR